LRGTDKAFDEAPFANHDFLFFALLHITTITTKLDLRVDRTSKLDRSSLHVVERVHLPRRSCSSRNQGGMLGLCGDPVGKYCANVFCLD
jgi:hypothetical protein